MSVSYNKLRVLLIDRNIKKDLENMANLLKYTMLCIAR